MVPTQVDESAALKFMVTKTLIVNDIQRSVAFYRDVLGGTVIHEGEPTFLRLGNIWLTMNGGGGPTDDKPEVVASRPRSKRFEHVFEPSRNGHQTLLRTVVLSGREIHHGAEDACNEIAVLYARPG